VLPVVTGHVTVLMPEAQLAVLSSQAHIAVAAVGQALPG